MTPHAFRSALFAVLLGLNSIALAEAPRVQEIPLPEEAAKVSYSKSRGDIRLSFPGDFKQAGEFYRQKLTQEEWTKKEKDNLQKTFWVQTFTKDELELQVRTSNEATGSEIRLTPKGYLWDEDFAPRPESIPIPKNASGLKYDDFFGAIEFTHADSPKQLIEFYAAQLDAKVWSKMQEDTVRADSAVLRRNSGGASIVMYIDVEDGQSKVKINTKGMSWDQIKLAKVAAKAAAKAKKSSSNSTSTSGGSANSPKRPNKPDRGIDKLEKLPMRASVTIDGQKIPLPEIIAFELISYGQWRTHVVATAQPVNQTSLLKLLKANVPHEKWGEQWRLPSPNLVLILDDDDSLRSVQLLANKVPGSATEVVGEAIVEAGRARGTAKLKPQKFFKHTYEGEITFDTELIKSGSEPRKLLEGAPKLANAGSIKLAGQTYSLPHVLVYEERKDDLSMIHVLLTEKQVDSAKVLASLKETGEAPISLIGFQRQIEFTFGENHDLRSMFLWCDGASVNWSGKDSLQSSVQSEGDRMRGTVKTVEKEDVFGMSLEFQTSFDTTILRTSGAKSSK